jgi:hypothetical protein
MNHGSARLVTILRHISVKISVDCMHCRPNFTISDELNTCSKQCNAMRILKKNSQSRESIRAVQIEQIFSEVFKSNFRHDSHGNHSFYSR